MEKCICGGGTMMKVYRGTDGDTSPVEMECELFGYPHSTDNGETMYGNTHFRTEQEAWGSILKSVESQIKLVGFRVKDARKQLMKAEQEAGRATEDYATATYKYNIWNDKRRGAVDNGEEDE